MYYDLQGQADRKRQIYEKIAEYTMDYFDQDGHWRVNHSHEESLGLRERIWFVLSYMESGDRGAIQLANRIITATTFSMCHFTPMAALQVLVKYDDQLEPDARAALTAYLNDELLREFTSVEMEFRGANDNYATMGAYTLLAAGLYLKQDDYMQAGAQRLQQLCKLLQRRGFTSECNSPTYTPIQAYCMAEIAELPLSAELQEMALQCEERLWVDLLFHYHPTTFQTAGPYSRAYAVDSTAHTHSSRILLYILLGDEVAINPMNTFFTGKFGKPGELLHHSVGFMQINTGCLIHTTYHCPAYLVEQMKNRSYPYRVQGTYEYSAATFKPQPNPNESDDLFEMPAGSGSISTYMEPDFAMGVMSREFRTGVFDDAFHLLYRRSRRVTEQKDIATVCSRLILNDKKWGESNDYSKINWPQWKDALLDEGRKIGIHHDQTAMMLYKPKIGLHEAVSSIKLSLLFSARYGPVEQIWLGEHRLDQLEGASVEACPVFVKDGPVYMAFFPLVFSDLGREQAVKVEKTSDYLIVSFYNYEGPERHFAQRGFQLTSNGFVAEVRSEAEAGSFEEFRRMFDQVVITDEWAHGRKISHMRRTVYEHSQTKLECVWNPISEGIKYIEINGKLLEQPKLSVSGLDTAKLPFMKV